VPLKILLADDSMTAQKMGKEILTTAGYEVIAVSNGAVAAKKLAEKPDIIILDVFMPGYTGLELCEKIRASMDLAKTPVLLTVVRRSKTSRLMTLRNVWKRGGWRVVVQFDSRFGLENVGVRFIGPGKGLDQSSPYKLLPCG